MNDNSLLYVIGGILAFILAIYITKAIFNIPTIVRNVKSQTALLIAIAKKHGVTDKEVQDVLNANGVYGIDIGFKRNDFNE